MNTKISFILDTFAGGGKERRCLQLIQGLNKQGYNNIQVIILDNRIHYKELYKTEIDLNIIDRKNRGLNYFKTLIEINKLIKKHNPDIIQVWGVFSALFTTPIRFINSFNYIGAFVADCNRPKFFSLANFLIKLSIPVTRYFVGNSQAGLNAYRIPLKKRKLIYNGFNKERLTKIDQFEKTTKDDLKITTPYVISMIARLDKNKDQETFIKAAIQILEKRKDITFLVIGEGPKKDNLQAYIKTKESEFVKIVGFRSDIEQILHISNLSVLCTNPNNHKEGVSNAILESMALGVPVIATNDGGTPEIVDDSINGFLIDPFQVEDLAEKICTLLDNRILRDKFSANALKTVATKFSLQNMVNQYIDIYNSLSND